jgi:hypothetical protein
MSRTWKWILGILAALVVVGLVVGAVFMWRNHVAWWGPRGMGYAAAGGSDVQPGPEAPFGNYEYRRFHMDDWAWRAPMMHSRGMPGPYGMMSPFGSGFFILAGLMRLILPLGVLALVAFLSDGAGSAPLPRAINRPLPYAR